MAYHIKQLWSGQQPRLVKIYDPVTHYQRAARFSTREDALGACAIMSRIITASNYEGGRATRGAKPMIEQAITPRQFAEWVASCHREVQTATGYFDECRRLATKLLELNVPEPWREPVRVMAQGGYYYGADSWMESAAGKTEGANAGHSEQHDDPNLPERP